MHVFVGSCITFQSHDKAISNSAVQRWVYFFLYTYIDSGKIAVWLDVFYPISAKWIAEQAHQRQSAPPRCKNVRIPAETKTRVRGGMVCVCLSSGRVWALVTEQNIRPVTRYWVCVTYSRVDSRLAGSVSGQPPLAAKSIRVMVLHKTERERGKRGAFVMLSKSNSAKWDSKEKKKRRSLLSALLFSRHIYK